ncbi:MAG: TlpA family protein disulfide reductase, partial [Thermoanaerobaculales bacterium]|nr:TlpA family protein disulfide reductase [Thermoanaerobaculales bacterium]
MKRLVLPLILLSLALGCSPAPEDPTPEQATLIHVGDMAPLFQAQTLDQTTFSLEAERGNIVLLSFFATWCPPCLEELPHLEKEVWARFRDSDFSMVAIGREHDSEELRPFVTEMGLTLPVVPDKDRSIYARYADAFIPRTLVVGPDGTVIFQTADFEPENFKRMVDLIAQAL